MPANHPGGGARRIEQNAVERLPIPETGGLPDVRYDQPGTTVQPPQIFLDTPDSLRVDVDRYELRQASGVLQQVPRLTAGSCTSIQHTHSFLRSQQRSR